MQQLFVWLVKEKIYKIYFFYNSENTFLKTCLNNGEESSIILYDDFMHDKKILYIGCYVIIDSP